VAYYKIKQENLASPTNPRDACQASRGLSKNSEKTRVDTIPDRDGRQTDGRTAITALVHSVERVIMYSIGVNARYASKSSAAIGPTRIYHLATCDMPALETKIVATRCQILRLKCTKFDFGWGSASQNPLGEACSVLQTT